MKIAQVVCTFPPYNSGMGNSVYNLSKALLEEGLEVTVFTPLYNKIENNNLMVKRIPSFFKFGNAAFLPSLMWRLKSYDVIHLHLPFLGATLPVWFFSILNYKKKIIVTYHMDLVDAGLKGFIFNIYKKISLPLILSHAKKIIVSSYDYAIYSDIKKYKEKFFEIPFWVDTKIFFPQEKNKDLMTRYFIKENDKVISFVGGLDDAHYFKGVDILLKAFKKIKLEDGIDNIKLLIIGDGDMKSKYMDIANGLGIRDDVIFTGKVSDEELPLYYNLGDVFVLPSTTKSEAFGITLLEASACRKALIASDLPGVRGVVDKGGLLAQPNSVEDLRDKLKQILPDIDIFSERAFSQFLEKYNQKNLIKKIIEIYKQK